MRDIRSVVVFVFFILISGFSGISMFKKKLWSALRRPLTVMFGLTAGGAIAGLMSLTVDLGQGSVWTRLLIPLMIYLVLGSMCACLVMVCAGSLLERIRARTPERLIALEHALRGRIFTRPVAAALTYGTLGGLLVAGITTSIGWVVPSIDGVTPWVGVSDLASYVSGRPALPFFLLTSLALGSLLLAPTTVIDLVERVVRRGGLVTAVCALFATPLVFDIDSSAATPRAMFLVSAVSFLESALKAAILVHLYRRYGFAASWLGYAVAQFLPEAVAWTWIGLPSLALQFYLGLALLAAVFTLGLWGLAGEAATRRLRAFDVS